MPEQSAAEPVVTPPVSVEQIRSKNCLRFFECGERLITKYARNTAFKMDDTGRARVIVAYDERDEALAFASLSFSRQSQSKLIEQRHRDLWSTGAPVVHLDFLAVQREHQGRRLGTLLLGAIFQEVFDIDEIVPLYGVSLNSLNDKTTAFYSKLGFIVAPNEVANPLMILPMLAVRENVERLREANTTSEPAQA